MTIKNLVFGGGSLRAIAYVGALNALNERKLLENVESVTGTSAGAAVATIFGLGYTIEEMKKVLLKTKFSDFLEGKDVLSILTTYGIYSGNTLLDWCKSLIAGKGFDPLSTFEDLENKGCKEIRMFLTNLNFARPEEFSVKKTPKVVVAEALRGSMSIPLFFRSWQFTNQIPNDSIYVDGGIMYNFPITAYDTDDMISRETLGFYIEETLSEEDNRLHHDEIIKYTSSLIRSLVASQDFNISKSDIDKERSIICSSLGIKTTDFEISQDEKRQLHEEGYKKAKLYIQKNKL